jgi:hypothetical protein
VCIYIFVVINNEDGTCMLVNEAGWSMASDCLMIEKICRISYGLAPPCLILFLPFGLMIGILCADRLIVVAVVLIPLTEDVGICNY